MALSDVKARLETLLGGGVLDVAILEDADVNPLELVEDGSLDRLRNAAARKTLFFDEHVQVTVVLQASASADDVHDLLAHLALVLAAHATDATPPVSGTTAPASGYHDVASGSITASAFDSVASVDHVTFVVWKAGLHLLRPRARLQRPAIYFTANLGIAPQPSHGAPHADEMALRPFEPLPANVLAPLNRVPEFDTNPIYLSAERLTKVAPPPPRRADTVKPLRGASKQAFPTLDAMSARINSAGLPDGSVASLHLQASRNVAGSLVVDEMNVSVPDPEAKYTAVALADQAAREGRGALVARDVVGNKVLQPMVPSNMPLRMSPGDETVLLYQIDANPAKLHVRIGATLLLDIGASVKLDITSEASDLSAPPQASPGTVYQWSCPVPSVSHQQKQVSSTSSSKPQDAQGKAAAGGGNITLYFTAPATTYKGDEFAVKVRCVNDSARARHVAIVPVHQRSAQSGSPVQPSAGVNSNVDRVADLCSAPPPSSADQTPSHANVMCVTPDVRMAPLLPGGTHDTQIIFRATAAGVLELRPLRIVDLETKQTADVWDLPDVVALETDAKTARKPIRIGKVSSSVTPVEDERFAVWRRTEEERIMKELKTGGVKVEA